MKSNIGLLPYTREDIYGLSVSDPEFYGWEITKFNIPERWSKSMGEDTVVAVIDTGVDIYHEDLKSNILNGKNFVEKNKDPIDVCGHGTHVASTIAATKNGKGMVGVSPKTKIIPVKALNDSGYGHMKHIIEAVEWSANIGCDFITMSLGSVENNDKLLKVISYANKKGSVVFCAAGNSGEETDIMFPAKYENTISIGSIDQNMQRTDFTCSGDSLDFLAPGHEILGCVPGNKYAIMSGTSMSNPFAVGCACLALSYFRKQKLNYKLKTYIDYIDLFKKNAISLTDKKYCGVKKFEGYGIINPI